MTACARYTSRRHLEPGEYVFRQGDPADHLILIEQGSVMIAKEVDGVPEPMGLGYRSTGEMLGEIALIREGPRTASVVATVPTQVLILHRDEFKDLMRNDPDFQDVLLETLIEQILEADVTRADYALTEAELFGQIASFSDEQRRLSEIIRLRQETISFIIHDLRNPINLASLAINMLELGADSPQEIEKYMGMARSAMEKMLRLIDSMLDVERLDAGEADLETSRADIMALLADVKTRFAAAALGRTVELIVEPDPDLPDLVIDANRIDRVLSNLLDNAFKFTPPGGTVTLRAYPVEEFVVFEVNDTGPGIPDDERERVFARFAQTEGGKDKRGFGLGLAFCRSAVLAHGGEIWVDEGDDGIGTKFIFTLPV
ncbi:MAG: ATP-binding protein [Anaerolineae bacterium]